MLFFPFGFFCAREWPLPEKNPLKEWSISAGSVTILPSIFRASNIDDSGWPFNSLNYFPCSFTIMSMLIKFVFIIHFFSFNSKHFKFITIKAIFNFIGFCWTSLLASVGHFLYFKYSLSFFLHEISRPLDIHGFLGVTLRIGFSI